MSTMKATAKQLAAQGRYGDTMLLHVSPEEVAGISSLIPGGLTTNPKTGLPEAFFFLPFLAGLFGAAAPAAAAATGAAAAGTAAATGAAAAGLTAAAAAPTIAAAAPAALGGISSLAAPATISASMLSAAPAAATLAAPAATTGLIGSGGLGSLAGNAGVDTMVTGSIGGAGASTPAATAAVPAIAPPAAPVLPATTTAIPSAAPAATTVAPTTLAASPETAATLAPTSSATTAGGGADAWAGLRAATAAPTVANTATTPVTSGITGLVDKAGSLFSMKNLPMMAIGMQALGSLFPQGGGGGKEEKGKSKEEVGKMKWRGGSASFPTRAQENDVRYGEHTYFQPNPFPNYQYANGGIVSLAGGGPVDPQMQPPQDMSFPLNGVPNAMGDEAPMEDIPSSNFPTSQIGTEPEPPVGETAEPSTNNDRELIAQTVEAIQGKIPEPGPILLAFVQEFGEPALQDLAKRVKAMPKTEGGQPSMPGGDGMSDSIPAMIDGQQPAALSQGEYVVPADVVSGMGNGSTDAGASQLDSLVGSVRQHRTGSPQQPPQMNAGGLIQGYAGGGIVSLKDGGNVRKPSFRGRPGDERYQVDPWSWGDFFNPMSPAPKSYAYAGPPQGAERGLKSVFLAEPYEPQDLPGYGSSGVKQYAHPEWTWGDFLNPMSRAPTMYAESPPSGGATSGVKLPIKQMPPHIEKYMRQMNPDAYPVSDDLADYGPGIFPEAIDRWIPSVQGYTTTGDWFATQPEIRRAQAKRSASKKRK